MRVTNKDGSLKSTRTLIDEARQRDEQKKIRYSKNEIYQVRGFCISNKEWNRLDKSITKIKKESPSGAVKQFIYNGIFKEFNDKILGPEDSDV